MIRLRSVLPRLPALRTVKIQNVSCTTTSMLNMAAILRMRAVSCNQSMICVLDCSIATCENTKYKSSNGKNVAGDKGLLQQEIEANQYHQYENYCCHLVQILFHVTQLAITTHYPYECDNNGKCCCNNKQVA